MGQMQKNEPRRVCVDVPSSQSITSIGTRVTLRPLKVEFLLICLVPATSTDNYLYSRDYVHSQQHYHIDFADICPHGPLTQTHLCANHITQELNRDNNNNNNNNKRRWVLRLQYFQNTFITNHKWQVIIGFNLNSQLKLLFYPPITINNKSPLIICCKNIVDIALL